MNNFPIGSPVIVEVVTYDKRGNESVIGDEFAGETTTEPHDGAVCVRIEGRGTGFYSLDKIKKVQ